MEQNVNGVFACAFDAEKVKAMRTYAEQKGIDLDAEITKVLERKYIPVSYTHLTLPTNSRV